MDGRSDGKCGQRDARPIDALWHDPVIPSVMDRSSEFYLMDSATYFFGELAKIGAPDYVPDEADVLRARTKTTGISETRFNMGQLSIHMFDVGGQRSERKKWIHCESPLTLSTGRYLTASGFEAVTSIIFCVALSEYDQVLLEENGQVSKHRHLVAPSQTPDTHRTECRNRWSSSSRSSTRGGSCGHQSSCFLNKIDVFKQKLPKVPLVHYFPEYTVSLKARKRKRTWTHLRRRRRHQQGRQVHPVAVHPDQPSRLSVYPHLTQATDTSNVSRTTSWRGESADSIDPARLRCGQGDDSAERAARLGIL